ncbi:hypothetical protein [Alienimonas chondri]|uniref:Protein translocase subunit SecA n=1 Tax=Alienimonas chondri TaxID=2681879 RepID=A0ABX1VI06_9PLAN|nr:hypothetical protein [Alienimonas chondri]NNJ27748.1 Protein translocase subunit SecA [Alienimonas chondri]
MLALAALGGWAATGADADFSPQSVLAGRDDLTINMEIARERFGAEDAVLLILLQDDRPRPPNAAPEDAPGVLSASALAWQQRLAAALPELPHVVDVRGVPTLRTGRLSLANLGAYEAVQLLPGSPAAPPTEDEAAWVREQLADGRADGFVSPDRRTAAVMAILDPAARTVRLTAAGLEAVGAAPPGASPSQGTPALSRPWPVAVERALHAEHMLKKDVDYVLTPGEKGKPGAGELGVRIVDGNTGRVFTERTWRDGLHQAVEAKEAVTVTEETRGLARVARQRFFGQYRTVCGMTGTAAEAAAEFRRVYGLPVVNVPPHKPSRRRDRPSRYFPTAADRTRAVVVAAGRATAQGRPVLIGTRTVAAGREVSAALTDAGLEHAVLDGLQDADEAELVAAAGVAGTITVATDMAGRGTDIGPDNAALFAGGLCVLACERHASARVDRQLAGRAGRQGDPGSARFFLSADDELFARHAPRLVARLSRMPPGGAESPALDRVVRRLQASLEKQSAETRRQLAAADDWLGGVLDALAA